MKELEIKIKINKIKKNEAIFASKKIVKKIIIYSNQ